MIRQLGATGSRRMGIAPERLAEMARWWAVGLVFLVINIPLLYILRDGLGIPLWVATLVGGEIGTLARFLVNDRWVFGNRRPTWRRALKYHAAVASSFGIWWAVTNALAQVGLHYLIANVLGQATSVGWSMLTNFGWIWRRQRATAPADVPIVRTTSSVASPAPVAEFGGQQRAATRPPAVAGLGFLDRLPRHLLACLFLIAAAAFIFQQSVFFGYRLIGNSDRLNHYLSFILYHTHNLEHGQFAAWSEYMYDGFDTVSLPMSFPTPLFALPALLHTDDVVAVFGYVAVVLLAITLIEAYFVVYMLTHDRLASLAGASTYACATYALLKLVQSDQTYLSVLTAPAFFYLIHTTIKHNWLRRYVVLTLLVAIECYFAFLQEFSYNVIFFFVYAGYLLLRRNRYPLIALTLALVTGAVLSLPRLIVQYTTAVLESGRGRGAPVLQDTVDLRTLLLFFSRNIFGQSWRDQLKLPVQLNFHEGDLVHASVFGALLLVVIVASGRWILPTRSAGSSSSMRYYGLVMVPYVLFVFAVMHIPRVYLLFARVYQNVSFQHSRLGVSALLPIAILTGLYLAQGRVRLVRAGALAAVCGSVLVIVVSGFDFSSMPDHIRSHFNRSLPLYIACDNCLPHLNTGPILTWDLLRLVTLSGLFVFVLAAGNIFGAQGRSVLKTVLGVAIVFQTVVGAADYVEGPQTRDYNFPYENNDLVTARSDQFLPPTPDQMNRMHQLLDNNNYRSVTICSGDLLHPDCNTMIGMMWGIRLMDGYASGVPHRLSVLPNLKVTLHDIRYPSASEIGWKTLSFLNVRQAIQMSRELYMNSGLRIPDGVQLVKNPSPYVYPRAYFADTTQAVDTAGAETAVNGELNACAPACDGLLHQRFPIDYVEAGVSGTYDSSGDLSWSGGGDRLTFDFAASPQPRFLVVNEMWDAGWRAYVDGQEVPVRPTNVAMRGVLVPAGASQAVMVYHSLLWWAWWYTGGLTLVYAIVVVALWKGPGILAARRLHVSHT
ncbi:MAG: GtrA family protein [Chloroflexota bacterium]|nr:GtrA family protein [Chloroflexota bacterium]